MAALSSAREGRWDKVAASLYQLIVEHQEPLVDGIVKDAIRQIPAYAKAPLRETMARVEQALQAIADSVRENDPDLLEQYLVGVAQERREEGYAILELHAIVHIIERHVSGLIRATCPDQVERNARLALLGAVMDAARMALSVRYLLSSGTPPSP
jgi:hypothetical protein